VLLLTCEANPKRAIIERTEPAIKSEGMIVAQAWLDAPEVVSLPSEYTARCRGRDCSRAAKTIVRALDSQGRPLKQIELCDAHLKALASARLVIPFCANP
jgi:hypothetical protein